MMEEGASETAPNKDVSDHTGGSVDSDTESNSDLRKLKTFRERLNSLLRSYRFHVLIVSLVVLDCLLVVVALLAEMRILETDASKENTDHQGTQFTHIIHIISVAILSFFVLEIVAKLYAFGVIHFFTSKLEVFDAIIVITSFILDIGFFNADSVSSVGSGLIVILRLWRVTRILNGIVLTVKRQAERKLRKERKIRGNMLNDLMNQRDYCNALEQENAFLRRLLAENNVTTPPPMTGQAPVIETALPISPSTETRFIRYCDIETSQ